jgi:hypothetical protein
MGAGEAVKVSFMTCHYIYTYIYTRFILKICGAEELHGRAPYTTDDHWYLLTRVYVFIYPTRIHIYDCARAVCIYIYI